MPETASAREHGARPGSQAAPPPSPPHSQPDFDALDALPRTATGRELWTALGAAGLTAWCYRDSGTVASGVHPDRLARVLAAADARFAIPTTLSASVQLATALPVLATDPRPLARRELARAVAGESAVALAATDVTAGTDLTALRTEARISDDGVEVHGAKAWIANTTTADHFLVLARHRTGRHFTHFTWVLVPADAPGVTVRPADSALFGSSGVGDVEFDGVRLGREHLVGRTGMGLPAFARHIATERLAGALWGTALCRRALEDTHRHLTTRAHGDGTLWELDAVRQRFAACLVRVRELHALSRQLGDRVAYAYDTGAAATLKAAAGATVGHVLGECAQLWGAAGFTTGGIQETRAQAALFGIGGGATEVVLSAVADTAETILAELANDLAGPGEDAPACGGALPKAAATGPEQGTDVPRPGLGLPRPGGGEPADGLTCPGGGASVWGGAPLDVGEAGPEQGAEARQPGLGLPRPENGQPAPGGGQLPPPARQNLPHQRGAGR